MLRKGLSLGNNMPPTLMRDAVQTAEKLGYEICWVTEGLGREAPTLLASMAGCTSTIRLGTAILPIYTRSATLMAQLCLSLDELSGGRFTLGLGVSHEDEMWPQHGIELERPFQRTREYVHVIKELLARGRISYHGRVVTVPDATFTIPMPEKPVPIYLAAIGPQMAKLAGQIADGVLFTMSTADYLKEAIAGLKEAAGEAGRDPSTMQMAGTVMTYLGPEAEKGARGHIAGFLRKPFFQNMLRGSGFAAEVDKIAAAWREGDAQKASGAVTERMMDELAMAGDPATWRSKVLKRREAGLDLVCPYLTPRIGGPEQLMEAIHLMAKALE